MSADGRHVDVEWQSVLERARRNTLGDLLLRTKERDPGKFALKYQGEQLTYAGLDEVVNQTARAFLDDGMKQGDMVAVMSRNSMDFVVVNFALARWALRVLSPSKYSFIVSAMIPHLIRS